MKKIFVAVFAFTLLLGACSKDKDVNLMSVEDDKKMGEQLDAEIMSNPQDYPVMDKASNPEAYAMVEGVMNEILKSSELYHRDEFDWQVRIIDTTILNAFAAPGGKLYFYTGLLQYMTSEAELAGVMAHEIAHADLRHSSERLTKVYGLQIILDIALGRDKSKLGEIASQMATGGVALKFSKEDEFEADEYSVRHLANEATKAYLPTAINDFFDRIVADGYDKEDGNMEFTRTHPYNANRKTNVIEVYNELGKPVGEKFETEYAEFKQNL